MTTPAAQPPAEPADSSPVLPVGLMLLGGYLVWFGVHYWRSDVKWPTDPVKAVLTGKPIPDAKNTTDQTTIDYYGKVLVAPTVGAQAGNAGQLGGATVGGAAGTGVGLATASGNKISADAVRYVGAGYVFGGNADRIGNWDCSSFVFYVLAHDLGMTVLGHRWGDPGCPPHAHGPVAASYKLTGQAVNRSQVQAGDLCVWNTHVGIAISNAQLVAARTPAEGTGISNIDAVTRDLGETLSCRRIA